MYLLNGVPFLIFVVIRDYCTPISLDRFPYATTLLSLSFKLYSEFFEQNRLPFDKDLRDITFHKLSIKVTKFPVATKLG